MNVFMFFLGLITIIGIAFWLMEKYARGWRTIALNALGSLPVIGATLVDLLEEYQISEYVPTKYMLAYIGGFLFLNIVMRMGTKTPVGRKDSTEDRWENFPR